MFYWPFQGGASFDDHFCYVCYVSVMLPCLVVTCWERANLLAPFYVKISCDFVTFPCGILGQVCYLIVSIPDLWECSDSVVEFLTRYRGAAGSSLTGLTALWSLSKNINHSLVLIQPRKTRPFIIEKLLMGRKESNQTNTYSCSLLTLTVSSRFYHTEKHNKLGLVIKRPTSTNG